MRAVRAHRRITLAAVAAASVALVSACGQTRPPTGAPNPSATPTGLPAHDPIPYAPGALLVSDGTDTIHIGGVAVRFLTTVTDAVWSPDGSRIAFVDRDGNISTSRPDGSDRVVLTRTKSGASRFRPAWAGGSVLYTELAHGHSTIMQTGSLSTPPPTDEAIYAAYGSDDSHDTATASVAMLGFERMAYEQTGISGPEVWVVDFNQREPQPAKVVDGAEPVLSPDGKQLAFVDRAGEIEVYPNLNSRTAKPFRVTFGAASPNHLAWQPGGSRIAYRDAKGVSSVSIIIKAGVTSNQARSESKIAGTPTYLRPPIDQIVTVDSGDLVAAAITVSTRRWPTATTNGRSANGVTIAGLSTPSAALVVANQYGPILFTNGDSLDPRTKTELVRVLGRAGEESITVRLLGDASLLSARVAQEVAALGYVVERIDGHTADTLALNALPEKAQFADFGQVVVVTSDNPALVSAADAFARSSGAMLLFSNGTSLSDPTTAFLHSRKSGAIYVVGAAARDALKGWQPAASVNTTVVGMDDADSAAKAWSAAIGQPEGIVLVGTSNPAAIRMAYAVSNGLDYPILVADGSLPAFVAPTFGRYAPVINTGYAINDSGLSAAAIGDFGHAFCGPLGYMQA